ncbi:MAG: hypothetical protein JW839_05340 [Candidatus Lokiarchaeota archaeon]|nr:hypothetical protein [Candidatus Lokiarchaeota archaeon]
MKATLRVDIKGDGTSVAFDFDLADDADRSRFKATCGLLARPEVTGESRERFLRQVVAVVDDVVAGKVPGHTAAGAGASSPFTKTALDVAVDRAGRRGNAPARDARCTPTRPALDLSELLDKATRTG